MPGDFLLFLFAVLAFYSVVAAAAIGMTLLEGWANRDGWTLRRAAGLVACLFWPLVAVVFILHNLFSSLGTHRQPPLLARAAGR
jgi:hypothetical protein